jgi:hypothetical protein
MNRIISVLPCGEGWCVRSDGFDGEMVFLSGAKAEAAARRLAETFAQAGDNAEIRIFLRDGQLAGTVMKLGRPLALAG